MTKKAFVFYLSHIKCNEQQLVLIYLKQVIKLKAVKAFTTYDYKVHGAQGRKVRQFVCISDTCVTEEALLPCIRDACVSDTISDISSYGQKSKTDKKDAKMLTIYGAKMQETLDNMNKTTTNN